MYLIVFNHLMPIAIFRDALSGAEDGGKPGKTGNSL